MKLRLALLSSFAVLMLAGCSSKAEFQASPQAPTVEVTEVKPGEADIYAEYPAQTYARNMVDVRGRVEGYIEKWLFRPGQEVTAGQPLYILDLRPVRRPKWSRRRATLQADRSGSRLLPSTRSRCGRRRPISPPPNPTS